MKSEQKLLSYLEIPEASLLGLVKRDFDILLQEELKLVEDWIKNKRCGCSKDMHVQKREIALKCEHIREEKINKLKEKEEKINSKLNVLSLRKLLEFQRIRQSH